MAPRTTGPLSERRSALGKRNAPRRTPSSSSGSAAMIVASRKRAPAAAAMPIQARLP
jgi:hypothetical protein